MALTALARFSNSLPKSTNALKVTTQYASNEEAVEFSSENRQLLRTFEIPPFSTRIEFQAVGDGCALVQTAVKYNVRKSKHGKTLKIELKVDALKSWQSFSVQRVEACVKTGPRIPRTNMAILEINLPGGFYPDRASLYQATASQKGQFFFHFFFFALFSTIFSFFLFLVHLSLFAVFSSFSALFLLFFLSIFRPLLLFFLNLWPFFYFFSLYFSPFL